jgi:hypothetical protein
MDSAVPECEFVSLDAVEALGVEEINRTFLSAALRKHAT